MRVENNIEDINFSDALGKRYISYAMATIMSRSLPNVRDGLKPVHRRLLYAMLKLRLDPESGFKKCARVVGDVIGKYHPHGDQAVYDTLVRLAQTFAVRYPLVDGQGNFGSLDGDNAAAMRYTEAKLTEVAMLLLHDIDKDTVDFKNTYDDGDTEPCILPAKFPNLLANGSEGIAVGMATSIPPHNVSEICSALIYLINNPECNVSNLVNFITGPDLPTGGAILETKESIIKSYETGRGAFRVRAKWYKEDLPRNNYQIVIYEIPYQVQKSKLIEKIADLYKAKKLTLLGNIRDESDSDLRIVIEPKSKQVDSDLLMEQLFKLSDLENRFYLNLNVLDGDLIPRVMNLKEVLNEFIIHRYDILKRKSVYELDKIVSRLEILEGYLVAYLNIDEVIKIIREEDEPKPELIKKFDLSDVQAESILNMRLRALRKLEEFKIKEERDELVKRQSWLKKLLDSELLQKQELLTEFEELKKQFSNKNKLYKRRTEIIHQFEISNLVSRSFIVEEPLTLLCSKLGWVRAVTGHNLDRGKFKYRNGDEERFVVEVKSTDKLILLNDEGKFFTLESHKVSRGKSDGQPLNLIFDLQSDSKIVSLFKYNEKDNFILATKYGKGFRLDARNLIAQTKSGKQIVTLDGSDKVEVLRPVAESHDMVVVVNSNRKMLIFKLSELPLMSKGKGVILQKQIASELCDVKTLDSKEGLCFKMGTKLRTESDIRGWIGRRATKGSMVPYGFAKNNKF